MTIEFDVEVVRKNNHLKSLFACRLKLHATSEMTDSGNPGVLSQALLDRLRYLVLYLRPFFLSNESVQEATEPAAKGKRGSPCTTQR